MYQLSVSGARGLLDEFPQPASSLNRNNRNDNRNEGWRRSSNYAELVVALDGKLGPRGLRILAFPSNEFGGQELGTDAEIA